jgi:hypothetical protein
VNLPVPPTDNFYKFCAIAGTIVYLLGFYIPFNKIQEVSQEVATAEQSVTIAKVEADFCDKRIRRVEKIVNNTINAAQGKVLEDSGKLVLHYSEDEVKTLERELDELHKSAALKLSEAQFQVRRENDLLEELKMIRGAMIWSMAIGGVVALFGYNCWYFLVQRHLDKALRQSVASAIGGEPSSPPHP